MNMHKNKDDDNVNRLAQGKGDRLLHENLTRRIIRCFYHTYNTLGHGFLEKVYERSLQIELERAGFKVEAQKPIHVFYGNQRVGEYFADLIVEDKVIIEIKVADELSEHHVSQLINYLRATDIEVGLVLVFGKKPVVVRRIYENVIKRQREYS